MPVTLPPVVLAAVLALPPSSQSDAVVRARQMIAAGQIQQALAFLETRTRDEPSPPELALLAELYAGTGAIPQAAATLDRLLERVPREHRLRTTRGAMLFELRRFDEAREELERALRDAPESETGLTRYYLAAVHKAKGELEPAREQAERSVALLPASRSFSLDRKPPPGVAARHLLAEIRFEQDDPERPAEPLLREVMALEPDHAPARYLLSRVLLKTGRGDEARSELDRFQRIKRAEEHLELGRHLSDAGRRDEAVRELTRATEADPENVRALVLLGRELSFSGRSAEAGRYLERAVSLRPDVGEWLQRLSR